MVLPIYVYGQPVLRKVAQAIEPGYEGLQQLIQDMWETLAHADGIGLAAPQIGKPIRLFIVDATPAAEDEPALANFKKVFINAVIKERSGDPWTYNEGCLSLPSLREDVVRPSKVTIEYDDEQFVHHMETYDGLVARIIQHEYDHIDGKLFIDHINPIRRKLLSGKLTAISKGKVDVKYKIRTVK